MAKVEAILGSETGKASSLEMLRNFYNAVAAKKAKQSMTPSIFGNGFNTGAASTAGFQA